MSLINPDSRWWRTNRTRGFAAYLLIVAGLAACFVGSWGMLGIGTPHATWVPQGVSVVCLMAPIPLILAGAFMYAFGVDDSASTPRLIGWALPLYFIVNGIGSILGVRQAGIAWSAGLLVFPLFIVGGVVAIGVMELVRRRSRAAARLRARVARDGVTARGVVTRAKSYSVNYSPVTRVTVRFTDTTGQTRWARQTIAGNVTEGATVTVRYSPEDLGRRAAVTVSR